MTIQKMIMEFVVIIFSLTLFTGDERVRPLQLKVSLQSEIRGDIFKPRFLKSVEDVVNLLGRQSAVAIDQQMQFETHGVLVFQWSGSGRDALAIKTVHDGVVTFQYTRGRTRDLRQHVQAFVLDKRIGWNVTEADDPDE